MTLINDPTRQLHTQPHKGECANQSISEWRDYDVISRYANEVGVSPNAIG